MLAGCQIQPVGHGSIDGLHQAIDENAGPSVTIAPVYISDRIRWLYGTIVGPTVPSVGFLPKVSASITSCEPVL